jgi:hypothetical protein
MNRAADCVLVSVVRDFPMYEKLVRDNPNNRGVVFHPCDNTVENKTITERYNAFLDSWDYAKEAWFIFLHEDFEFLEPPERILAGLDAGAIYGALGLDFSRAIRGLVLQCERGGGRLRFGGRPLHSPELVSTTDCCCMIVHSSLVARYNLRFDVNLSFDFYTEDFEMDAHERFGIKTFVAPMRACHWSYGSFGKRFFVLRNYLLKKYSSAKSVYFTTTFQAVGPLAPVAAARRRSVCGRIKRRLLRLFWRKRYGKTGWFVITVLGLPVYAWRYANLKEWLNARARVDLAR